MNKILAPVILIIMVFMSCKDSDNTVKRFKALDDNIRRSNDLIFRENNRLRYEMESKLKDPQTAAKASLWYPKMDTVRKLSESIVYYIDSLRLFIQKQEPQRSGNDEGKDGRKKAVSILFEKQHTADTLFKKLIRYKQSLLSTLDPRQFFDYPPMQEQLLQAKARFDSIVMNDIAVKGKKTDPTNFLGYFNDATWLEVITILDKIKNDVLYASNTLMIYFDGNTNSNHDDYLKFSAILTKNSNYLKKGDTLEVFAGIGAFSESAKPTFIINGTTVPVNEGRSTYQLKITNRPGKYRIPVIIDFIQADGKRHVVTETIQYTVVK